MKPWTAAAAPIALGLLCACAQPVTEQSAEPGGLANGSFTAEIGEKAPALLEQLFKDAGFSWPHAEYANLESAGFDVRDRLGSISTRSLVVAGAHDTLTVDTVRVIHDGLANSQFVVFENSGHHAPVEEPERFRSVLLEFLGLE